MDEKLWLRAVKETAQDDIVLETGFDPGSDPRAKDVFAAQVLTPAGSGLVIPGAGSVQLPRRKPGGAGSMQGWGRVRGGQLRKEVLLDFAAVREFSCDKDPTHCGKTGAGRAENSTHPARVRVQR